MKEQVDQQEPEVVTPGNMLKQARLQQQLSIEQVAVKLNLRPHNIQALEEDQYDSRISVTFTKGYLRAYAKLVKVSETEILTGFEQINQASKEPAKLQSFSKRVAKQASDDRLMMLTYVIFAVLIALSLMWWFQQPAEDKNKSVSTMAGVALADRSSGAAQTQSKSEQSGPEQTEQPGASDDTTDNNPQDSSVTATDETAVVADSDPAAISQQPTADEAASKADNATENPGEAGQPKPSFPASQRVELVFTFANDCWINIVDATGQAIAYGTKVAGRTMPVNGVPPFQITLGAPSGVTITYAGKAVDLSRFPATQTAKFTLPLQD